MAFFWLMLGAYFSRLWFPHVLLVFLPFFCASMSHGTKLPENAVYRRINELVKRARSVKVHAFIVHYLRKQMPYKPWGKKEKQRKLIDNLEREFVMCARRYDLPRGDFPEVQPFRQALREIKDLTEIPKLDKKMIKEMEKVFSDEIQALLQQAGDNEK